MASQFDAFKQEFARMPLEQYVEQCKLMTAEVRQIADPAAREEGLNALLKVVRWYHNRCESMEEIIAQLEMIQRLLGG